MIQGDYKKVIEDFLMDVDILDKLESKISNFNVFHTLGVINAEIRHSNVISWLLTPNDTHGLDDVFLKKFLQEIFYNHQYSFSNSTIDLFKVSLMDYHSFQVRREWKNIDILFFSEENEIVITIENKVWSKESKKQLNDYYETIQSEFPHYNKVYLYLTPNGDRPSDEENWISIDYNYVVKVLEKSINLKKETISEPVKYFLEQYLEVLRRHIVGDKELEAICREIYYKHQKALDLIFEFKPDIYSEISEEATNVLKEYPNILLDISNKSYTRFITKTLDDIIPVKGSGWTNTKRILLFEIQNKNDKVVLKLIIGPGESSIREKLYEIAEENKTKFKGKNNGNLTLQYTQIYATELVSKAFIEQNDIQKIREKVQAELKSFLHKELPLIENLIVSSFSSTNN